MYPVIDSVSFVTHDRRHVHVNFTMPNIVELHYPLCDDKQPLSFELSVPTHLDYDEGVMTSIARRVRSRYLPDEAKAVGMGDSVDAYFQILRGLIPCSTLA